VTLRILITLVFLSSCGLIIYLADPGVAVAQSSSGAITQPSELSRQTVSRKVELKKALAESMRNDAYALQGQRRFKEAVLLYRESLSYWPDDGLETYIRSLEARSGFTTPGRAYRAQGNLAGAGRERTLLATFRNRSSVDVTVRTADNKESAGLLVLAGDITTISVPVSQGQVPVSVLQNGKVIASTVWYEDPGFAGGVPCLLFDTALSERLVTMTGLRKEGT
jgi:hypothetical protein